MMTTPRHRAKAQRWTTLLTILALALGTVWATSAPVSQAAATAATAQSAATGVLTGTVTSGESGAAGVIVKVMEAVDAPAPVAVTQTRSDGSYRLDDLAPGGYLIQFDGSGTDAATGWYPDGAEPNDAARVEIAADQTLSLPASLPARAAPIEAAPIKPAPVEPDPVEPAPVEPARVEPAQGQADMTQADAQDVPGGSISGVLTDAAGVAADGVEVLVRAVDCDLCVTAIVHTDATGAYRADGLPANVYVVQYLPALSSGLAETWWPDQPLPGLAHQVTVHPEQDVAGIDQALPAAAAVSGQVLDTAGSPIAGVHVTARRGENGAGRGQVTGPDGRYTITNLAVGTYTVLFDGLEANYQTKWWQNADDLQSATTFALTAGQQLDGLDATLRTVPPVQGRVTTTDGAPAVEVSVTASGPRTGVYATTLTDGDGRYVLNGLPPGNYHVIFGNYTDLVTQWWQNKPTAETSDLLRVPRTGPVDAVLERGATISGTLSGALAGPTRGGSGGNNRVVAVDDKGRTYNANMVSADDHSYQLTGLAPGTYTLTPYADLVPGTPRQVVVAEGVALAGYDFELPPGATLSGSVAYNDGTQIYSTVTVRDAETGYYYGQASATPGAFSFAGLPPRPVRLSASIPDVWRTVWYPNSPTEEGGQVINLTSGADITGIDVRVEWPGSTGNVYGRITVPGPENPANRLVYLVSPDGQRRTPVWVNSDGTYRVQADEPGTWKLDISARYDAAGAVMPVPVPPTGPVDVTLQPPGALTGRLVSVAGTPLPGKATGVDSRGAPVVAYYTNSDGWFTIDYVNPGPITLTLDPDGPYASRTVQVQVVAGQTVTVPEQPIELGGWVNGTVHGPATDPFAQAEVLDAQGAVVVSDTGPVNSGEYWLGPLAPGEYTVRFSGEGLATQYWKNAATASSATKITVTAGGTVTGIDATLTP